MSTGTSPEESSERSLENDALGSVTNTHDANQNVPSDASSSSLESRQLQKRAEALRDAGESLYRRCMEKTARLNEMRARANQTPRTRAVGEREDQSLDILRAEEARLQFDIQKLQDNRDVFPEVIPEVTKLCVRQMVQDTLHDYKIATPLIQNELEETKKQLAAEKQTLKEAHEIKMALQARLRDLAEFVESGASQESSQGRQKLLEARMQVQDLMKELTGFLAAHHPPIQPDSDGDQVFELKHVLEDIMNLSVSRPSDPYVVLVPGEYYPPHIEQLINAGIAVRHPRDAQRLRLIDFYS